MTREELDWLQAEVDELGRQEHREARRDVIVSHYPALLAAAREAEELREWQREAIEWFRGELDRSRATEGFLRALLARVKP